ncbi:MAG TPA: hypothetical protein VK140_08385 [Ktedonobacteraceae bacterium]|nr:hypothetical protein [Ktedonobacteraceae bacterium]
MSMTQATSEYSPSRDLHCPHCNTVLPPQATFCASCGERIVKKNVASLLQDDVDIAARYRITSLVRRRPYVNLLFAIDNQLQRPVAIRDIDITVLNDEERIEACEIVQREYDLLRREHIPSIMTVIELRHFRGHLYVIAGWPYPVNGGKKTTSLHLHTLQDVLQSGNGLPDTQVSLCWVEQICSALDNLHRHEIVLGDLDPQALILGDNSYDNELVLMVSWLPHAIRNLLPRTSAVQNTTNFSAPEVLLGKPEPRSDIYSLGAVLYLLLTGTPPEEPGGDGRDKLAPTARMHRRSGHLRLPAEFNSRINNNLDEFVMKALSIESSERFLSAADMRDALYRLQSANSVRKGQTHPLAANPSSAVGVPLEGTQAQTDIDKIVSIDTILISPLPAASLAAWQAAHGSQSSATDLSSPLEPPGRTVEGVIQPLDEIDPPPQNNQVASSSQSTPATHVDESPKNSFVQNFKQRITGIMPAIPRSVGRDKSSPYASAPSQALVNDAHEQPTKGSARGEAINRIPMAVNDGTPARDNDTFLKQLQRLVRGEQKHVTTAAAIIETPLRVQPNQAYTIRIQLMGREEAEFPQAGNPQGVPLPWTKGSDTSGRGGLSALVEGDLVHIEVRSAIYQNYAYIVQQATVAIPASGYAAEVTMPMQPLSSGPNGRRDRLHIFFTDEIRRPLYEKPFVVELFISHLVQPGREGHNVLTIPL